MAYDEALAARVDALLSRRQGYVSKRMFGGIAMMLGGNMAVGVIGTGLLVRLPREQTDAAMTEPGTRPFEMGRRAPGKGWVVVVPEAVEDDETLREWVERGVRYARSLPPKAPAG